MPHSSSLQMEVWHLVTISSEGKRIWFPFTILINKVTVSFIHQPFMNLVVSEILINSQSLNTTGFQTLRSLEPDAGIL